MSKKNDDFFKEKKPWSIVKDELLACYLKPYFQMILATRRPTIFVDCFAGKGKFDDGNDGSPIIALNTINECLRQSKINNYGIYSYFIDLHYADELSENLSEYSGFKVVSGKYEEQIYHILSDKQGCNVFLYIDPYGVKALECSKFDQLALDKFYSVELLINFNSFGFIRAACAAMGTVFEEEYIMQDLDEYDSSAYDSSERSRNSLDDIAGGDYWRDIIESYKLKSIDGFEAERQFADQYCKRLQRHYKFVLNMPIRIKKGQQPKYRMVHATNHSKGCLLMVDNMQNRWELLKSMQNERQMTFWSEDFENQPLSDKYIITAVEEYYSKFSEWVSLDESLAGFYVENGVIAPTSSIKNMLVDLEGRSLMLIERTPKKTRKDRLSTFMSENRKQKVDVKWNQ